MRRIRVALCNLANDLIATIVACAFMLAFYIIVAAVLIWVLFPIYIVDEFGVKSAILFAVAEIIISLLILIGIYWLKARREEIAKTGEER